MGRPRLYNTPEEKKAAKAADSKRCYARFVINHVSLKTMLKKIEQTPRSYQRAAKEKIS
jgi:hypothetical protein